MVTVVEAYEQRGTAPLIACDFSPPRSGDPAFGEAAVALDADFICVAYSPGKTVRMDSVAAAATVKRDTGRDVIFNLSPRDMNRLAIQMHLLGAQALGLENVLVLQGDELSEKDLGRMKGVSDFRPTELVRSIREMNEGLDFKGLKLAAPTRFCAGATADLGRDLDREARLTHRKIEAGARYLVTQSVYTAIAIEEFRRSYAVVSGAGLDVPVLFGVQVLVQGGLVFGDVPESMKAALEAGRPGPEIALELARSLMAAGAEAFYVIPPILKGGARDYEAAGTVIRALRAS